MYFPQLIRKPLNKYYNRNDKFYADYKSNYEWIHADCLGRCVYCDATEKECGGDKFSLDHFRPRDIFEALFNGVLMTHPYNLYLSCQKCNVLKSSDWKGCLQQMNGPTYASKEGYIDRFDHNSDEYLKVNDKGEIESIKADGPVDYMIKKMMLNRPNRTYLRKKRSISSRVSEFANNLCVLNNKVIENYKSGKIKPEEAMGLIEKINNINDSFRAIT
jgi:hypothetical protein